MRPLKGGLDAWEKHGYPLEAIPPDETRSAHEHDQHGRDDLDGDTITIRATAPE